MNRRRLLHLLAAIAAAPAIPLRALGKTTPLVPEIVPGLELYGTYQYSDRLIAAWMAHNMGLPLTGRLAGLEQAVDEIPTISWESAP